MKRYQLESDEVILYESLVKFGKSNSNVKLTLTNKKMIFEKEKGIFKRTPKVIGLVFIENIKTYKNKVQIKQKKSTITIQTIDKNIDFTCESIFEAKRIIEEIIDIRTGSNILERTENNITKVIKGVVGVLTAIATIPPVIIKLNENKKEIIQIIKNMKKNN